MCILNANSQHLDEPLHALRYELLSRFVTDITFVAFWATLHSNYERENNHEM
jgi:hypothetical protein